MPLQAAAGFFKRRIPSLDNRNHRPTTLILSPTAPSSNSRRSNHPRSSRDSAVLFEEDELSTSFQEFCAVCDKQIASPNNAILYCSESCRVRDSSATLQNNRLSQSAPFPSYRPRTPSSPNRTDGLDIIPQRSPTLHRPHMPRFHIDTDTQDAAFEIEQTLTASREKRPSNHRSSDSEAAVYLRQFQSSWRHPSRPNTSRIPSLSHTPSSSTSISLSSSDYQYEPPIGSSDSRRESSVFASNTDLVTPIAYGPTTPASLETIAATRKNDGCEKWSLKSGPAATQISMGVPEPDLSPYEEKPMPSSGQGVSGSIRQLFNFDAMRQDHLGM